MSKKSWIALIVMIVVVALLATVFILTQKPKTDKTNDGGATQATEKKDNEAITGTNATGGTEATAPAAKYNFTLEIVHANGEKKTIPVATDEEIIGEYLEKAGIIEGAESQYGMYIAKVEGEKAVYEEDGAYWAFYVDGEYASKGVDQTPIENGKVYQLKYEKAY